MDNFLIGHFLTDILNKNLIDTHLISVLEFLACIHLHTEEEDLGEISKTKTIRMIPLLCGLASKDKSESQKIVYKVVKSLGNEEADYKNTEEYLRYLQGLFLGI